MFTCIVICYDLFRVVEEDSRSYTFGVTTLSKELVLSAENVHMVGEWLDHLRAAKQRAIKESLGHATELVRDEARDKGRLRYTHWFIWRSGWRFSRRAGLKVLGGVV